MLDNNDVCYQVDTGTYLSTGDTQILTGYSGGEQQKWLEKTLREASTDALGRLDRRRHAPAGHVHV